MGRAQTKFDEQSPKHMSGLIAAFEEHRSQLGRLLAARTGDSALAEDLLQDLWIRLQGLETGPVSNPVAYLSRMASNLATDYARSQIQRRKREEAWVEGTTEVVGGIARDEAPNAERALLTRQELQRAADVITRMPPRAAQIFRLHRIDGLGHGEIAATLGISRSAVEKSMAIAIKFLMKEFSG